MWLTFWYHLHYSSYNQLFCQHDKTKKNVSCYWETTKIKLSSKNVNNILISSIWSARHTNSCEWAVAVETITYSTNKHISTKLRFNYCPKKKTKHHLLANQKPEFSSAVVELKTTCMHNKESVTNKHKHYIVLEKKKVRSSRHHK